MLADFRSIENRVAMSRITRVGQPSAVDPYRHSLASIDNQALKDAMMIAQLTSHRVLTLYSIIGDFFTWLCVAVLLVSIRSGIYHYQGKVRQPRSRT